jgi:hypothetical protein
MVPNQIDKQMHCDIKVILEVSLQFVLILDFVIIVSSSCFRFL